MFRVRQFISHEAGKAGYHLAWMGVGGEWKETGTSSKGLHNLQHREACSDCRSKWNSKKKKKKATGESRKLQRPVGRILWIFEQKKISVIKTMLEEC